MKEDLWIFCKVDPNVVLTDTKIVTHDLWYEKNVGVERIYKDMETLVKQFTIEWYKEHPEPDPDLDLVPEESDVADEEFELLGDWEYQKEKMINGEIDDL